MERLEGNLLEQVPIDKSVGSKIRYKALVLDFLVVASAFYVSYSCADFLRTGAIVKFGVGVFLFLILSSFEAVLVKSFSRRFILLLLETAALLSFFYNTPIRYLGAAGGIFLALSIFGEISSRSKISNSIQLQAGWNLKFWTWSLGLWT